MFTKRRRWRGVCLLGLAAIFAAGCQRTLVNLETPTDGGPAPSATPRNTDERVALLVVVNGPVDSRANPDSPWSPAAVGQILVEGQSVRTGPSGRALVQLTEGSKIWLGPGTTFTVSILNPFLDSLLTSLKLEQGEVWVLLNGGALDVETPAGVASARSAYLSAVYNAATGRFDITCLQGTCSFGSVFIPGTSKLLDAGHNAAPEPMTLADFGVWGLNVPEATQLAALATEAVAQGNATLPVMPSATITAPAPPTALPTSAPALPTAPPPPTATALPILGEHTVHAGETIFCIGRGYGVLPAAIAQANGLTAPYIVIANQRLRVPAVQWTNISVGPVCAPQFASPYPAPPPSTPVPPTPVPTPGPVTTRAPFTIQVNLLCLANCDGSGSQYRLRLTALVSGGAPPYTFDLISGLCPTACWLVSGSNQPIASGRGQQLDFDSPHCQDLSGSVSAASADGQSLTSPWRYHDPSCP